MLLYFVFSVYPHFCYLEIKVTLSKEDKELVWKLPSQRPCENHGLEKPPFLCCSLVAKSCLTPCDPMDCSPPGSSVYGLFQARILEWIVISFSRGSSRPRVQTRVSCIGRWILHHGATLTCMKCPQQGVEAQCGRKSRRGFLLTMEHS